MTWNLVFDPMLPVPVLIALAVVAALMCAVFLWRRMPGAIFRLLAFVAVLGALADPTLQQEQREPLSSVVALVVDRSQSQDFGDRKQQTEATLKALKERLEKFDNIEVRVVEAGRGRQVIGDGGTRIFTSLTDTLSDVPPDRIAGAVLITDGQIHDIPAVPKTYPFPAPIHALITGNERERDRRIVIERAPKFGLVGKPQTVKLRIVESTSGRGPEAGGQVTLRVLRNGRETNRLPARIGAVTDIPVMIEQGGKNIVEFSIEVAEDELTAVNNRAVATIEGIRENLRVLLVSGEPHAGERTWRNLLKSDASVDLVHFTILRPPEKQDATPINELSLIAFPTRELFSVKIDQFDLIIFDRYRRRSVLPSLYFDNIARYVRDGGAVMVAAGPDYADPGSLYQSPLAVVLPAEPTGEVIEKPYHAKVTDLGTRHPVTRGLPGSRFDPPHWSRWFRLIDIERPKGQTVMSGADDKPLLLLNRIGKGRIALLLSDHAWLWARGYEGGGPHVSLLRRISHWLMGETDLEEETLRLSSKDRSLIVERQTLGKEVAPVEMTLPSGEKKTIELEEAEPGLWRARVEATEIGLHSVGDGKFTALAHVGPPNPREYSDVLSTTTKLASIASATGGAVRRVTDDDGRAADPRIVPLRNVDRYHGNGWLGLRRTDAYELKGLTLIPLFSGLIGLALLLGLVSAMWYREGR